MEEYKKAEGIEVLGEAEIFNKCVCEGAISIEQRKYEEALKFFCKTTDILPDNKEGYIFKFLGYISSYLSNNNK